MSHPLNEKYNNHRFDKECDTCKTKNHFLIDYERKRYGCITCAQKKSGVAFHYLFVAGGKRYSIPVAEELAATLPEEAKTFVLQGHTLEMRAVMVSNQFLPDEKFFNWKSF